MRLWILLVLLLAAPALADDHIWICEDEFEVDGDTVTLITGAADARVEPHPVTGKGRCTREGDKTDSDYVDYDHRTGVYAPTELEIAQRYAKEYCRDTDRLTMIGLLADPVKTAEEMCTLQYENAPGE